MSDKTREKLQQYAEVFGACGWITNGMTPSARYDARGLPLAIQLRICRDWLREKLVEAGCDIASPRKGGHHIWLFDKYLAARIMDYDEALLRAGRAVFLEEKRDE